MKRKPKVAIQLQSDLPKTADPQEQEEEKISVSNDLAVRKNPSQLVEFKNQKQLQRQDGELSKIEEQRLNTYPDQQQPSILNSNRSMHSLSSFAQQSLQENMLQNCQSDGDKSNRLSSRMMIQKGKHQTLANLMRTINETIEQTINETRNIEDSYLQDMQDTSNEQQEMSDSKDMSCNASNASIQAKRIQEKMIFCKNAMNILQCDIQTSWMDQDDIMRQYALAQNLLEEFKEQIQAFEKKIDSLEMTNSVLKGQVSQNIGQPQIGSQNTIGLTPLAQFNNFKLQLGLGPIPLGMPSMQMNMLAIQELKKHANQESEHTKMLVTLLEEVLHDYTANDLEEEVKQSVHANECITESGRSLNSVWNKSQFSKVLRQADFGSRQQVRQLMKEKKYGDLLEKCLKALKEVQNAEIPGESLPEITQPPCLSPPRHHHDLMNKSYIDQRRSTPQSLFGKKVNYLNMSQIQERNNNNLLNKSQYLDQSFIVDQSSNPYRNTENSSTITPPFQLILQEEICSNKEEDEEEKDEEIQMLEIQEEIYEQEELQGDCLSIQNVKRVRIAEKSNKTFTEKPQSTPLQIKQFQELEKIEAKEMQTKVLVQEKQNKLNDLTEQNLQSSPSSSVDQFRSSTVKSEFSFKYKSNNGSEDQDDVNDVPETIEEIEEQMFSSLFQKPKSEVKHLKYVSDPFTKGEDSISKSNEKKIPENVHAFLTEDIRKEEQETQSREFEEDLLVLQSAIQLQDKKIHFSNQQIKNIQEKRKPNGLQIDVDYEDYSEDKQDNQVQIEQMRQQTESPSFNQEESEEREQIEIIQQKFQETSNFIAQTICDKKEQFLVSTAENKSSTSNESDEFYKEENFEDQSDRKQFSFPQQNQSIGNDFIDYKSCTSDSVYKEFEELENLPSQRTLVFPDTPGSDVLITRLFQQQNTLNSASQQKEEVIRFQRIEEEDQITKLNQDLISILDDQKESEKKGNLSSRQIHAGESLKTQEFETDQKANQKGNQTHRIENIYRLPLTQIQVLDCQPIEEEEKQTVQQQVYRIESGRKSDQKLNKSRSETTIDQTISALKKIDQRQKSERNNMFESPEGKTPNIPSKGSKLSNISSRNIVSERSGSRKLEHHSLTRSNSQDEEIKKEVDDMIIMLPINLNQTLDYDVKPTLINHQKQSMTSNLFQKIQQKNQTKTSKSQFSNESTIKMKAGQSTSFLSLNNESDQRYTYQIASQTQKNQQTFETKPSLLLSPSIQVKTKNQTIASDYRPVLGGRNQKVYDLKRKGNQGTLHSEKGSQVSSKNQSINQSFQLSQASYKSNHLNEFLKEEKLKKLRNQEQKLQELRMELERQEESLKRLNTKSKALNKKPEKQLIPPPHQRIEVVQYSFDENDNIEPFSQHKYEPMIISQPTRLNIEKEKDFQLQSQILRMHLQQHSIDQPGQVQSRNRGKPSTSQDRKRPKTGLEKQNLAQVQEYCGSGNSDNELISNHASVSINLPKVAYPSLQNKVTISNGSSQKSDLVKKRRTKIDRTLKYPEGSTFNDKTVHLKPKKTMRFDDWGNSLRPSTQLLPTVHLPHSPKKEKK